MLDALTLDQLRVFIAVVDEGSFSAAARRLKRVQSAVSHSMANLERQLGVEVFDRSPKVPVLTERGHVLLAAARRVCAAADDLRHIADGMAGGLEPSVSLVVDALYPLDALVRVCQLFRERFSTVSLRVHTETMGSVAGLVLDGTCLLGVVAPVALAPSLVSRHATTVRMATVVGAAHPLAEKAREGRVPAAAFEPYVQIVLSERAQEGVDATPDQAVLSPQTWRVVDLSAKHAMLRGGLGWGNMPAHMVREDLASGALVRVRPEAWPDVGPSLELAVVHRKSARLGPAARWLLEELTRVCNGVDERGQGAGAAGEGASASNVTAIEAGVAKRAANGRAKRGAKSEGEDRA